MFSLSNNYTHTYVAETAVETGEEVGERPTHQKRKYSYWLPFCLRAPQTSVTVCHYGGCDCLRV